MKIQRLTFLGVSGLPDLTFDLTDPASGAPHDVVFITGPAASGKTRALEAIVAGKEGIAPYGPVGPGAPWIATGGTASKVAMTFWLDEEERTYAGTNEATMEGETTFLPQRPRPEADEGLAAVLERYDHKGNNGKLEYFPSSRRLPVFPPFHGTGTMEQRILRPGKDARKYSFIPRFLRDLEAGSGAALAFAEKLAALSATCRYEHDRAVDGMPVCFRSRGGTPMPPDELSDAESDAVIFAATAVAVNLTRSIVLVDRPDLFADPRDIKRFLGGLLGLGAGNQLIMATSSPELLAAAEGALVLRIDQPDASRR